MKNLSSDLHPSRRCGGGCGQCGQLPVHQSRFVLEKLAVVQAPVVRPAAKRPGLSTGAALSTARGFGGRWCSRWSRPAPKENSLNLENFCLREVDRFRKGLPPLSPLQVSPLLSPSFTSLSPLRFQWVTGNLPGCPGASTRSPLRAGLEHRPPQRRPPSADAGHPQALPPRCPVPRA